MITYKRGDVTTERNFANPVNLVGIMGRGLALEVRRHWPGCFGPYQRACRTRTLRQGRVLAWRKPDGGIIFQTPTKTHWRDPSLLSLVEASVAALVRAAEEHRVESVGVPMLGCGLGGLRWYAVRRLIAQHAADTPVEWRLYGPAPPGRTTGPGH